MDSYLVDIETGEFDLIAKNSGIGYFLDVCESGTDAILAQVESRSNANLFLLDFSQRSKTLLTPHEGPASIGDAKFSSKGRAVYFSSDIQQEMTAFCRISLSEQKTPGPLEVLLARPDGYLEAFEISKDGSKAVLCWNMAGHNEIELFDLKTLERHEGPKLPAERASFPTLSRDGNLLALELSGPASPKDIHVFNLKDPSSWQVTHSPHPGLDLSTLVRPQLLRFSSHDGLELSGWLFLPTRYNPPGPLVMSFHGGPEAQERPDFRADYQALLTQGIAVFAPNVRGSVGFGKTFANLDNGVLRHNAILDIKSCAEFVIKSRFADPKKIGIMGESYGGYMTLAGVTEFPDLFAAGADLFGIVNFETFFKNTEPWMADISKVKYGDPETQKDLLRRLSPIHQLDRVTAPTIVLHGANDKNVPVDESKQVVESLKKNGIPTELVVFQDEGHGFLKEPNRIQATIAVVDWFSKYLLK
jgi:dipeptidyl aminopeptidase/acylaminoacyl peptidase